MIDTSGPLRGFKRDVYEGGIRVPFIARWPGKVSAGKSSDELVAFWDMMPTLAEVAGATPPANVDGISVLKALEGGAVANPHAYLYWDYGHNRERYDQAVRMGDWKGVRLGRETPIELYDLSNDIGEQQDVAKQHPDIVRQIETIMARATVPNARYEVGKPYTGGAIWKKVVSK